MIEPCSGEIQKTKWLQFTSQPVQIATTDSRTPSLYEYRPTASVHSFVIQFSLAQTLPTSTMQEIIILGFLASALICYAIYSRLEVTSYRPREHNKRLRQQRKSYISSASRAPSPSQITIPADLPEKTRKVVARLIKSRLIDEIIPSVLCMGITSTWLATHELFTSRERTIASIWQGPLYLSALSSCAYLVMHNLGRDICFFPKILRTTNEIVVYNTARSACHGVNVILHISVLLAKIAIRSARGPPNDSAQDFSNVLKHGLASYTLLLSLGLIWIFVSILATIALFRDIAAWDKQMEMDREVRRSQNEEMQLREKMKSLEQEIWDLESVESWGDNEFGEKGEEGGKLRAFAKEKIEKGKGEIMRLKVLVAVMPMKIAGARAKMD
jgi:uncharacterized membrane protein YciS (DUF1049 family)